VYYALFMTLTDAVARACCDQCFVALAVTRWFLAKIVHVHDVGSRVQLSRVQLEELVSL